MCKDLFHFFAVLVAVSSHLVAKTQTIKFPRGKLPGAKSVALKLVIVDTTAAPVLYIVGQ